MSSGNEGDYKAGVYKEFTETDNTLNTFVEPTVNNDSYGGPGSLSQGWGAVSVWADTADPLDAFIDIYDLESPDAPIYSLNLVEGQKKFLASGWSSPSGVASSEIDRNGHRVHLGLQPVIYGADSVVCRRSTAAIVWRWPLT